MEEGEDFHRALLRRDRERSDYVFEHARDRADAAGDLDPTDRVAAIPLSMLLAQERERRELAARVVEPKGGPGGAVRRQEGRTVTVSSETSTSYPSYSKSMRTSPPWETSRSSASGST